MTKENGITIKTAADYCYGATLQSCYLLGGNAGVFRDKLHRHSVVLHLAGILSGTNNFTFFIIKQTITSTEKAVRPKERITQFSKRIVLLVETAYHILDKQITKTPSPKT